MGFMKVSVLQKIKNDKNQLDIRFATFKLPASTKNLLGLNPLNIILKILVYEYLRIGPSSVVYIFHKGIIS